MNTVCLRHVISAYRPTNKPTITDLTYDRHIYDADAVYILISMPAFTIAAATLCLLCRCRHLWESCSVLLICSLNEEEAGAGFVDDIDDAVIGEYLASQVGDLTECDADSQTVPRQWPKGRGSKLLNQTLYVQHYTPCLYCMSVFYKVV